MSRRVTIAAIFLLLSAGRAFADDTLAQSIIDRFYRQENILGVSTQYRLTQKLVQTKSDGSIRARTAEVYVHDPETTMVVLQFPDQRPELFLKNARGSWLYKEGLRTPLRISDSFKLFGAANLADVLGINLRDDYVIQRAASASGGLRIYMKGIRSGLSYPFAIVNATPSGELRSIVLSGANGVAMKRITLSDYRDVSGNHRLPTWTITDLLFPDEGKITIQYLAVTKTHTPASLYQPNRPAMNQFLSVVGF